MAEKQFDIAIAGEINLDLILYGLPQQMPVERELLATGFTATLGSSSAIVAHNAATLGMRVVFTGLVGNDDFGSMALQRLQQGGVDTSYVHRDPTLQTGITIMLPHARDRHMFTYPGTIEQLTVPMLSRDMLRSARHLHLCSLYLQKGLHDGLPELIRELKASGMTISLDTNDDPADVWGEPLHAILPLIDCFMPNEREACRIAGVQHLDDALARLPDIPVVVIKRGSHGATVVSAGTRTDLPPVNVTPVDTIGAGDSFDAGFLSAWLRGCGPVEAAKAGNIAGALSTQAAGGTEAFRDMELRQSFLRTHGIGRA